MTRESGQKAARLFLIPAAILITLCYAVPGAAALLLSLTDISFLGQQSGGASFVGLGNFYAVLGDSRFYLSLRNTAVLIFCSAVLGQQLAGFLFAWFLRDKRPGFRSFVRMCVLPGWLVPDVVAAFVFYSVFSVDGYANDLLNAFGTQGIPWLFNVPLAVIILADVWSNTAYSVIIYESALRNLDPELSDAARTDGATPVQTFFMVTIPAIGNTIWANTLLVTMRTAGSFTLIYLLTGGGPAYESTTLPLYFFQNTVSLSAIGYGSALGCLMLALILALNSAFLKIRAGEDA